MATVEQSQQAVDDVRRQQADWTARIDQTELEIQTLDRTAGALVAGATDGAATAASIAGELGTKRAFLDIARRSLAALATNLERAEIALLRARADELIDQAAQKRREADARQQKTDELLAALREYEGVDYIPSRLPEPDIPTRRDEMTGTVRAAGGPVTVRTVVLPITEFLRHEADNMTRQAAELRDMADRRQHALTAKTRLRVDAAHALERLRQRTGDHRAAMVFVRLIPDLAAMYATDEPPVLDAVCAALGGDLRGLRTVGIVEEPAAAWERWADRNNRHEWEGRRGAEAQKRYQWLAETLGTARGAALRLGA